MPKVLLTTVCRPLGPAAGDAPTVGYELLFAQVTRAQGLFSPRATHLHFGLEYIAENLDAPTVVLQYPTKKELIAELRKGYDFIGISFLLAIRHKMVDLVALIREHSPRSKIVLGGYGTVLPDEMLRPYCDHICREEGVAFFRRLLAESERPMPYRHPLIVSRLRLFSLPVSRTGMVFAGLGCPNGCDFCCTSHFFERKHIKLLPTGRDIYSVIERYLDLDPAMSFTILDEDFLLNRRRAQEFKEAVRQGGRPLSIFCFASLRALSLYTPMELLEMGIDGCWIGYEGTRSGYAKQQGRPAAETFRELREHGITILASMIVGFDYQTPEIIAEELDGLLALEPSLSQFLIYGPTPGTPFWERMVKEGRLRFDPAVPREVEGYCKVMDGFTSMVHHPTMSGEQIERQQQLCFEKDFRRLGASIYRVVDRWLRGYRKLKGSPDPLLRAKAERFARDVRNAYPSFLPGKLFAPSARARAFLSALEADCYAELGAPTFAQRAASAAALGAAAWTGLCLAMDWFQHPRTNRTAYRMPEKGWTHFSLWEGLEQRLAAPGIKVQVDLQHAKRQVWVRLEGALAGMHADEIWERLRESLTASRNKLVLDLQRLTVGDATAFASLRRRLESHRDRVRVILPTLKSAHPELLLVAKVFAQYRERLF